MGLSNEWYWKNWISTCQKMNLDVDFTPFTKIIAKWMIDLDVK